MMLPDNIVINAVVMAICFFVLAKGADFLVDGAVGISVHFKIPKIVIGIVLVGFATTAPEFTVTMISAAQGVPDIALGNAIGSVIANTGLALALGIVVAPLAIRINPGVLKSTGVFLIVIILISFSFAFDMSLSRIEGGILLLLLAGYIIAVILYEKRQHQYLDKEFAAKTSGDIDERVKEGPIGSQFLRFFVGVAMVAAAGKFLVDSAVNIALFLKVPESVIGLSVVAIGTSLPEIATCIVAAHKGHGDLAFGDIVGANILNILWIIGGASVVSTIQVDPGILVFSFPAMFVIVSIMLLLGRFNYYLQKWKGYLLLIIYLVYFVFMIFFLYLPAGQKMIERIFL